VGLRTAATGVVRATTAAEAAGVSAASAASASASAAARLLIVSAFITAGLSGA
jgi:hypothetical protein